MKEHEKIAAKIFSDYGLDFKTATRAGGWTNAVWLNEDLALRLSLKKDSDRIRREVSLAEHLPDEIGYPINLEVGVIDGYEWSLSKRIYGNTLSEVWSNLAWKERTETIRQILGIMELLHEVDINKIEALSSKRSWYSSFDAEEINSCLEKYRDKRIFTDEQIDILYDILQRFWGKLNSTAHVLNHGDITTDNLLWSNGRIVSLLDFEFSVIAPSELDLHSLINLAFFSDEDNFQSNCSIEEYQQYKLTTIEMLKPLLNNSYSADLVLGYAIIYRMRFLEFWFENPEGKLEELDAYIKLLSLANGKGGYLSEIIYP